MSDRARTTFATWVYVLFSDGVLPDDAAVLKACHSVRDAGDEAQGESAGEALVQAVSAVIGDDLSALGWAANKLYGARVAEGGLGETRDDRTTGMRRYQFDHGLPWLAWVHERRGDGSVTPDWLIIERVDQVVYAMDPDPWDGIDEDRTLPLGDFHVLWELGDCLSVRLA